MYGVIVLPGSPALVARSYGGTFGQMLGT
jgi:hypothetical protein